MVIEEYPNVFFDDQVAEQIKERFKALVHPVKLVVFSAAMQAPESEEVKRLIEELATLDPRLSVESKNFILDEESARSLRVHHIPGIAILRAGADGNPDRDYGVRFFGLPMEYDFGALIDGITEVSRGDSELRPETLEVLSALTKPVHLQVFSTPTCPFCPRAIRLAYRFAIASDKITADGIEVTGFPDLAQKYRVSSVPKTVAGDAAEFVGAQGEEVLLDCVKKAAAQETSSDNRAS